MSFNKFYFKERNHLWLYPAFYYADRNLNTWSIKTNIMIQRKKLPVVFMFFDTLILSIEQLSQEFLILVHCCLQICHQRPIVFFKF